MKSYIFRHLRNEQLNFERRGIAKVPSVSLKTLFELFPNRPQTMIRSFLREINLVKVGEVRGVPPDELYGLRDGARMPTDVEVKKMMTPEAACALEALYVAQKQIPINMYGSFGNVSVDKLRMAVEMLSEEHDLTSLEAAKVVEQAVQTAPWALTDTFVTAFREGRAVMQLAGPADPTSRGLGYSFIRDIRHKVRELFWLKAKEYSLE